MNMLSLLPTPGPASNPNASSAQTGQGETSQGFQSLLQGMAGKASSQGSGNSGNPEAAGLEAPTPETEGEATVAKADLDPAQALWSGLPVAQMLLQPAPLAAAPAASPEQALQPVAAPGSREAAGTGRWNTAVLAADRAGLSQEIAGEAGTAPAVETVASPEPFPQVGGQSQVQGAETFQAQVQGMKAQVGQAQGTQVPGRTGSFEPAAAVRRPGGSVPEPVAAETARPSQQGVQPSGAQVATSAQGLGLQIAEKLQALSGTLTVRTSAPAAPAVQPSNPAESAPVQALLGGVGQPSQASPFSAGAESGNAFSGQPGSQPGSFAVTGLETASPANPADPALEISQAGPSPALVVPEKEALAKAASEREAAPGTVGTPAPEALATSSKVEAPVNAAAPSTTSTEPAPVTTVVHSVPVTQVADTARTWAREALQGGRSKTKTLEIQLDPPRLGRIQIKISSDESGAVKAVVQVENRQAQGLLEQQAPQLHQRLAEAGVQLQEFSLGGFGSQPDRSGRAPEQPLQAGPASLDDPALPQDSPARSVSGLINLRV